MSDAVSTTRTDPDGTVTVTLPVDISGKDWTTAMHRIRALYSGRYVQWLVDAEGHDVFVVAAAVDEQIRTCGLCEAGQPHGHGHGTGSWV